MAILVIRMGVEPSKKPYQIKKLHPITLTILKTSIRFITNESKTKSEAK